MSFYILGAPIKVHRACEGANARSELIEANKRETARAKKVRNPFEFVSLSLDKCALYTERSITLFAEG